MLNLNKCTKSEPTQSKHSSLRTSNMCVRMTVHNCRTQHNIGPITVLIIFPRMFQTILAQMTTTDGRGGES